MLTTVSVSAVSSLAVVPVQRSSSQDAAIIAEIIRLGHEPLSLPRNDSGKRGVKIGKILEQAKEIHEPQKAIWPAVSHQRNQRNKVT